MPTSDLVARYKVGSPRPQPTILNMPAIKGGGFTPPPVQVPLGQQKRIPYNAATSARPSELIASAFSGHNIPPAAQWATTAQQQRSSIMQSLQRAMTMPDPRSFSVAGGQAPGGSFGSFVNAIKSKESGGNYSAVNRHSGAAGAYQIMPGNIGPWSREILGRTVSRSEFLSNPRIQDAIAIGKLKQYYNKYGAAGAAVAWYAGPGAVSKKMGSTAKQGQYPSIQAYWQSILKMM